MRPRKLRLLWLLLPTAALACSAPAPSRPMPAQLDPVSTSSPVSSYRPSPNPLASDVPDATTTSPAGAKPARAKPAQAPRGAPP